MACGNCDYVPAFEIHLAKYVRGGYKYWADWNGSIDGIAYEDFEIAPGTVAYGPLGIIYNVLEGDQAYWEVSDDNVTFISLNKAFAISSNRLQWSHLNSTQNAWKFPWKEFTKYFRVTVTRAGCDPFVSTKLISVTKIGGDLHNAVFFQVLIDGVFKQLISTLQDIKKTPEQMGIDRGIEFDCRELISTYEVDFEAELLEDETYLCLKDYFRCHNIRL